MGDGKALAHSFRTLQHWNQWLAQQFLGTSVLATEKELISNLAVKHFGKHAVLIGVPNQYDLLNATSIPCHSLVSPLITHDKLSGYVEGDFHELPLLTGSVDLVMLPHSLEFVDNPRQLLSEACRIVKPEGLMIISGFNPYSTWGLKKNTTKHKVAPWSGNFIHSNKVKRWLHLADFAMEKQTSGLFRPPVSKEKLYRKLEFLERIGNACLPMLGGVYVLVARAKVVPLTPIRMKWKQQLSGIQISSAMSGRIAHKSK